MTVPEFLESTKFSRQEIADKVGVHLSRVYDWANGECVPEGPQLLKLVELSDYKIRAKDLPRKNRGSHFRKDKSPKRTTRRS